MNIAVDWDVKNQTKPNPCLSVTYAVGAHWNCFEESCCINKPPIKRPRLKIKFLTSYSKHVGAQKKHLDETVLLSTQSMF